LKLFISIANFMSVVATMLNTMLENIVTLDLFASVTAQPNHAVFDYILTS